MQICAFFTVRDTEVLTTVLGTDTGRRVEGVQGMQIEFIYGCTSIWSTLEYCGL